MYTHSYYHIIYIYDIYLYISNLAFLYLTILCNNYKHRRPGQEGSKIYSLIEALYGSPKERIYTAVAVAPWPPLPLLKISLTKDFALSDIILSPLLFFRWFKIFLALYSVQSSCGRCCSFSFLWEETGSDSAAQERPQAKSEFPEILLPLLPSAKISGMSHLEVFLAVVYFEGKGFLLKILLMESISPRQRGLPQQVWGPHLLSFSPRIPAPSDEVSFSITGLLIGF